MRVARRKFSLYINTCFNKYFQCNCKNGYTRSNFDAAQENCVDIDECSTNNICDENAECFNEPGGYSCRCRDGYTGNGYICQAAALSGNAAPNTAYDSATRQYQVEHQEQQIHDNNHERAYENAEQDRREHDDREHDHRQHEQYEQDHRDYYQERGDDQQQQKPSNPSGGGGDSWMCDQCSKNAECINGVCTCLSEFHGDGYECVSKCPAGYLWKIDGCTPLESSSDELAEQGLMRFVD